MPLPRVALVAGAVVLIGILGALSTRLSGTLMVIAATGILIQVALVYLIVRAARPRASLTAVFAVAWLVMFTFRLLQITVAPDLRYHHPAVFAATDSSKIQMWLLTTLGLVVFWLGTRVASRLVPRRPFTDLRLPNHTVLVLSYLFLLLSYALAFSGIRIGLAQNAVQFYLFIIAYASFESARSKRTVGPELGVVLLTSLLALKFGFKELAVLPVLAWIIGQWSAGRRVISAGGLAAILIGAVFYLGIQSQRTAEVLGETTAFLPALQRGLTDYDLSTGTYQHKTGLDLIYNPLAAVGTRLAGVDSLFAIKERTPGSIPFQNGKSLWQPAVSILPGTSNLLSEEFSSLSLGRYFSQRFWSLRPEYDTSSQALTVTGDFYLNFGAAGVLVGLVAFGILYTAIDRRTAVTSATTAGLFAYAAVPLLTIERNVAYLLVTAGIRYAVGLAMIQVLRQWSSRTHDESDLADEGLGDGDLSTGDGGDLRTVAIGR